MNLAKGLTGCEIRKRAIFLLRLRIDEHCMSLIECAALRVLSGQANGVSFEQQRTKRQRFGESIIHWTFAMSHFGALLEQSGDFRMNVKAFRHANERVRNLRKFRAI